MLTFTYTNDQVSLEIKFYRYANGQTSMIAYHIDTKETWLDVTLATQTVLQADEVAIKDYGHQEGIVNDLESAGIITNPHKIIESGFIKIPVARLCITPTYETENVSPFI